MGHIKISEVFVRRLSMVFFCFLLLQCSSDQQANEEAVNQENTDSENGKENGDEGDGVSENASTNGQQEEESGEENKSDNSLNSDDPYDDDWNDVTNKQQEVSQNQQANNQKSNNSQNENFEEPPLNNANKNIAQPVQNIPPEPEPVAAEPPMDAEPAPVVEAPPSPPPPENIPAPVPSPPPPVLKKDIEPVYASLIWVGYDHVERDGVGRVEMVTRGSPRFDVFQEYNKGKQPELVIRFLQTALRDKLKRDIDASEFRSPVGYIRMRPNLNENFVDVIITLRDPVQPRLYTKNGDVMLSFPLADHYFGNHTIGQAPVAKAEVLPESNIMPLFDSDSDASSVRRIARANVTNPGVDAFKDAPPSGGEPVAPTPVPVAPASTEQSSDGLPQDFSAPAEQPPAPLASNVESTNLSLPEDPVSQEVLPENSGNPQANSTSNNFSATNGQAELDGELPPENGNNLGAENATGEQAASDDQGGDEQSEATNSAQGEEEEGDPSESLDEDTLDDFDSGDGESSSEIEKFDVRIKSRLPLFIGMVVLPNLWIGGYPEALSLANPVVPVWQDLSIAGVAQDDFGDDLPEDESGENGGEQSPEISEGGLNQEATPTQNTQSPQNNFGATPNGEPTNAQPLNNAAPAGNNASAPNQLGNPALSENATANPLANPASPAAANANAALGGVQNTAPTPAANEALVAPEAPVTATPIPVATESEAAPPNEPPLAGNPDLSGQEQVGSDNETPAQPSKGGRPIKLDFRGAPLTEVIRMLAEESGVNFVFPPEIGTKPVFVNLTGVPFNDALRALLDANGLGMIEAGPNIVRIDTLARLAADKTAEEQRKKAELKLRPTKVLVYRLSYAKVEDAQKMLKEMLGAAAKEDQRISVQLDARTNSIIVNAPPGDLSMVKALLERIDLETPQVKIASRIVELQKKFRETFGISWVPTLNFDQGRGLGFGNLAFHKSMNARFAVDAGGNDASRGTMGFRFGSINNALTLDLALAMEESRSAVEVLQSGNLIVEDNTEAEIVAGSSDFFRLQGAAAAGRAGEDLAEVTYNLTMKVKPHITADGAVQMKVTLESDSPSQPQSQGGGAIASKDNRGVTTSLLRKSGETAVIGGIYNTQKEKANGGIPGLMNLPIIGALFRNNIDSEVKRELLVMVTPTIINSRGGDSANQSPVISEGVTTGAASQNGGAEGANFNLEGEQASQENSGFNSEGQAFSNSQSGNQATNQASNQAGNQETGSNTQTEQSDDASQQEE